MSGINKVIIMGYLKKEPLVTTLENGAVVSNFLLSTITKWLDKKLNKMSQHVEWHRVVMYGKLAEVSKNIFREGDHICVEGYLRTNKFIDKQGIERYVTEIVAKEFEILHGMYNEINSPIDDRGYL